MATDKKPVTSYLSTDLEEKLTEYCKSKGLVRDYKNGEQKAQLGTAVVEILESFFGETKEDSPPSEQQSDQISELKGFIYDLTHRVEQLESTVPDTVPSNGLSTVESNGESSESTVPDTVPSNGLPSSHTQPELAERFKVSGRTISNNLKKGSADKANKFCEKHDRYYWQWHEQDKLFYPQLSQLS